MKFAMVIYVEETKQFEISARRDENSDWCVIDVVDSRSLANLICQKLEADDRLRNRYINIEEGIE